MFPSDKLAPLYSYGELLRNNVIPLTIELITSHLLIVFNEQHLIMIL